MQQPQEMINKFNYTNKNMCHDEIIFHMKRGETLLIQSAQGKWLRSIYWGYLPSEKYSPIVCNWDNRIGSTCSIDDVPCIGPQIINNEIAIVSFCKFPKNGSIWPLVGPEFITPLPAFNLRENLETEMGRREWNTDTLCKKSGISTKPGIERIQRFLIDKESDLPKDIIKKLACGLEISEAKLCGYGDDEAAFFAFFAFEM